MKKKPSLRNALIIFTLLVASCIHAQRSTMSLEFAPGYSQEGFGAKAAFNYYHNRTDYYHLNLIATFSNEKTANQIDIPYNNYLLNVGYFTPVFSNRQNSFSVFVGGGLSVGYETVNKGNTELSDGSLLVSKNQFLYGPYLGVSPDISLSDEFSLIVPMDLFYHFGSDLGGIQFLIGIGARYYLN